MNRYGDNDLLVAARSALLDALDALHSHLNAVIVIGAQAIYLHTGGVPFGVAAATKDSDLALNTRELGAEPLLEEAMREAGFHLDLENPQAGAWLSRQGIPVDLMVPESLSGSAGRRGARIPPHWKKAARRAAGLEAAVIDYQRMEIPALDEADTRIRTANVAGPAALLVAKLHKLGERRDTPHRLVDKDAHDIYRLLRVIPTDDISNAIERLRTDPLAGPATEQALVFLTELFASNDSIGPIMAGRVEEEAGLPAEATSSVTVLANDLLDTVKPGTPVR